MITVVAVANLNLYRPIIKMEYLSVDIPVDFFFFPPVVKIEGIYEENIIHALYS